MRKEDDENNEDDGDEICSDCQDMMQHDEHVI